MYEEGAFAAADFRTEDSEEMWCPRTAADAAWMVKEMNRDMTAACGPFGAMYLCPFVIHRGARYLRQCVACVHIITE